MIPTVQQAYSRARLHLGDETDQIYHNEILEPDLDTAYGEMFAVLDLYNNKKTQREAHFNLPARTTYLDPATVGLSNFGEPIDLRERTLADSFTITAVDTTSPPGCILTLSSSHSWSDGQEVIVYLVGGISDEINDNWVVDVSGLAANQIKLLGCTATGSWTSGGVVASSTESWSSPMEASTVPPNYRDVAGRSVGIYQWRGDIFRFPQASEARQIKIVYSISGSAPIKPGASLGVDDSLRFLSYRMASTAGYKKGHQLAETYERMAIGQDGEADGHGGFLAQLVGLGIQTLQNERHGPRRWRQRRTSGRKKRYGYYH